MSEATGFAAETIHRLLVVDPKTGGFERNRERPLDDDLLVVDGLLMRSLLEAMPDRAALVDRR